MRKRANRSAFGAGNAVGVTTDTLAVAHSLVGILVLVLIDGTAGAHIPHLFRELERSLLADLATAR